MILFLGIRYRVICLVLFVFFVFRMQVLLLFILQEGKLSFREVEGGYGFIQIVFDYLEQRLELGFRRSEVRRLIITLFFRDTLRIVGLSLGFGLRGRVWSVYRNNSIVCVFIGVSILFVRRRFLSFWWNVLQILFGELEWFYFVCV